MENKNLSQNKDKQRIEYIDLLKGFSILWVVLLHSYYRTGEANEDLTEITWRTWLFVQYRMPLFFFASGIFFRLKPFKEFLTKRINTIIIPFLGFWLIGFLCAIVKYVLIANYVSINFQGMGSFIDYATSLKGLFYLRPDVEPTLVNVPLWFLVALFIVQLIHFLCCNFIKKKTIIFFIGMVLFIISIYLKEEKITGLFYVTKFCNLYIFYLVGNFSGTYLTKMIQKKDTLIKLQICSLSVLIILPFVHTDYLLINELLMFIRVMCFFPVIFTLCKFTAHLKIMAPIKYCGKHSLEILATHFLLISLFSNLIEIPFGKLFSDSWLSMLFTFFICVALEYFVVIKFCNRYLFFLLGKSKRQI